MFKRTCPFAVVMLGAACLVLACGVFSSPDHSVRVKNNNSYAVAIAIGTVDYGTINAGVVTVYKSIDEGRHDITGGYTGYVDISGNGKHKWTLTLDGNDITIKED